MAANNLFAHAPSSERPGQGENLAMAWNSREIDVYTPEQGWYEGEIPFYDFETGENLEPEDEQIGHFTQMVWDDTTEIGCGEARFFVEGWHKAISVCRYSPPGNWRGQYTEHVHPLI